MIEEREIITIVLGLFAGLLAYRNRESLALIPGHRMLLTAWVLLFCGSVTSVLEGIFWSNGFNALEHVTYGLSSSALTLSIFLGAGRRAKPRSGAR